MSGFAAPIKKWFSEENVAGRQAKLDARREKFQQKGFKHLTGESLKLLSKVFWGTILTVLLGYVAVQAIVDSAWTLIFALPICGLLAYRPFRPYAAGAMALLGVLGILVFASNPIGTEWHIPGLYGTVMLTSLVAAFVIDRTAVGIVAVYVLVAFVVAIAIGLIGALLNATGDFPTNGVKNFALVGLALAAIGSAFYFTRFPAAVLVLTTFSAAGFHQYVWAYDGFRRQNLDVWGLFVALPDQLFYGLLLLLGAWMVYLAVPSRRKIVITEEELPPAEDETAEMTRDLGPVAAVLFDRFYELDRSARIFTRDGSRFLAKTLAKARVTQEELDEMGLTIVEYSEYAAERVVYELRQADTESKAVIIRKDGTVHPDKLVRLGFRKDFLEDHGILPEELQTGKIINDLSEDRTPRETDSYDGDIAVMAAASAAAASTVICTS